LNSKWSTSIGYSFVEVTNTNFQTPGTFHRAQYASINLLAYPADNVMLGGELLWGKLENNPNVATPLASGDDVRFQFSVKYNFGTKL
jgi:hypothetical protein